MANYRETLVASQELVYKSCGIPAAYTFDNIYATAYLNLENKLERGLASSGERMILQITYGVPPAQPYQPLTQEGEMVLVSWTPYTLLNGCATELYASAVWVPPQGLNSGLGPMGQGTDKLYYGLWTSKGLRGLRLDMLIVAHSS